MPERVLFLRVMALTAFVRLGLWLVPLRTLDGLIGSRARSSTSFAPPVDRLVWAVRAASRRIPHASCLTQSLVLHYFLARSGRPSRIHIGVAKDDGTFQAHAWVESNGRILLNTPSEVAPYVRLASWGRVAN